MITKIKKIILLTCLLLNTSVVFAKWEPFGQGEHGIYYIDFDSVKMDAVNFFMWVLHDRYTKNEYGHQSVMVLWQVQCNLGKMKTLSYRGFSERGGQGKLIDSFDETIDYDYIDPNSPIGSLAYAGCGYEN